MLASAFGASWQTVVTTVISTISIYLALIIFSRIAGLRSFAQMTNFDMAAAMAFGSLVATTAVGSTSLSTGVIGLAVLFVIQWLLAQWRLNRRAEKLADNNPLLLMCGDQVLFEHLSLAQMTFSDLRSKLRLAGVTSYDQVAAVVLEVTGDVSVLLRGSDGSSLEPDLFASVRGREKLFSEERFPE